MPLPSDERVLQLSERIIGTMNKLFGEHPGYRTTHARGVLFSGNFVPTPEAARLSTAPHFQTPTPVYGRFSSSTGVPQIPDTDDKAEPRGFGLRFQYGDRKHTDIVAHSTNAFPARTADEFVEFLESILGGPPAIGKFLSTHPTVGRFLGIPKPTPESYGTEAYYAVSAFQFNAPDGSKRFGRYTILPKAGVKHLTPEEASGRSPSFLLDEIVERVSNGPVEFELWLQLANEGDQTDDATVQWPEDRERVLLGTVKLDAIVPDGTQKMQYIIYDPIPRVEGIEATEDPLFEVRAAVYLISGRKRRAAPELKA